MKYLLSFVLGIVVGAAAAAAAIFFNPLITSGASAPPEPDYSLSYRLPEPSSILLTHNRQLGLPIVPNGAPTLWELGIQGALLSVLALENEADGGTVLATRVSIPAEDSNLISQGALIDDSWLLTLPGQGSMFVYARNNQWPMLRDTFVNVDLLRRPWSGAGTYTPTVGPRTDSATVQGLSGSFAGRRGRAWEQLSLENYDGRFDGLQGELLISLEPLNP